MVDPNVRRNAEDTSPPIPSIGVVEEDEDNILNILISDKNDHTLMSGDEEDEKKKVLLKSFPSKTSLHYENCQKNGRKKIKTSSFSKETEFDSTKKRNLLEVSSGEKNPILKKLLEVSSGEKNSMLKKRDNSKKRKISSSHPRKDEGITNSDRDDVPHSSSATKSMEEEEEEEVYLKHPQPLSDVGRKEKNLDERNSGCGPRRPFRSYHPAEFNSSNRYWRPPPRESSYHRSRQLFQDSLKRFPCYPTRSFPTSENVNQPIQRSRKVINNILKSVFVCVVGDSYSVTNGMIAITEDRCGPNLEGFLIHDMKGFEALINLFLVGHESMYVWNNIKSEFPSSVKTTFLEDRYSGTCAFCNSLRCHKWNVIVSGLQQMTQFSINPLDH